MADVAFPVWSAERSEKTAPTSVQRPGPVVLAAPVLISDCMTPLAGETVLSLLCKRLDADG